MFKKKKVSVHRNHVKKPSRLQSSNLRDPDSGLLRSYLGHHPILHSVLPQAET